MLRLRFFLLTETICGLIAALPFFLLLGILYHRYSRTTLHKLGIYCFSGYILAMFAVTGIPSLYRLRFHPQLGLVPFDGFASAPQQFFLNLLLFVPLGFLLPFLWRNYRSFFKTVLTGFFLSLFIEIFQLFSYRATDIDDLLMNTLGTVGGWGIFMIFYRLFPQAVQQFRVDGSNRVKLAAEENGGDLLRAEPLLYMLACWLATFLLQPLVSQIVTPGLFLL